MSSTSSSPSSSRSISPETKTVKRKRNNAAENDGTSESSDSDSDSGSEQPEEPVLSHAERRRQKREAKKAEKLKESGLPPAKKRKLKDSSAVSAAPRQNSVWVGNLSYKTQQDNIRTFFDGVGEITRINMPTKPPAGPGMMPESRGFAYVDFATPEAKLAAITLSEQPLIGRKLLIKDGDSFEGRPSAISGDHVITDPAVAQKTHSKTAQKILRAQKQAPAPTLFFGNLPFETKEDDIRQLLDAHKPVEKPKVKVPEGEGEETEDKPKEKWIKKIRMGTFEDTGHCKGFTFVDFTSIDNATAALINPKNHHLNGRTLVVEYASADAVRRGASKNLLPDGGFKRRPPPTGYKKPIGRPKPDEVASESTSTPPEQSVASELLSTSHTTVDPKKRRDKKERIPSTSNPERPEFGRHKGPKSRPKPGAALALAKRETAAIVPSQGQKITF